MRDTATGGVAGRGRCTSGVALHLRVIMRTHTEGVKTEVNQYLVTCVAAQVKELTFESALCNSESFEG